MPKSISLILLFLFWIIMRIIKLTGLFCFLLLLGSVFAEEDKFEVSSASLDKLTDISWVWEVTWENILNYFDENLVCDIEELESVDGVWPSTLDNIKTEAYLDLPSDCDGQNDDKNWDENEEEEKDWHDEKDKEDEEGWDYKKDEEDKEEWEKISILTWTKSQLETISQIWGTTAQNIIDYREENLICEYKDLSEISWIWWAWSTSLKNIKEETYLNYPEKCNDEDNDENWDKDKEHEKDWEDDKNEENEEDWHDEKDECSCEDELKEKNQEINTLEEEIENLENEISNLEKESDQTDSLESQITKLEEEINDLEDTIEDEKMFEEEDIIYLNDSDESKLEKLTLISWIGEGTVDNIKDYREENEICSFYDLDNVSKIWDTTIKNIIRSREVLVRIDYENCVERKDENEDRMFEEEDIIYLDSADELRLEKLPWIGEKKATNIIEYIQENQICSFYDLNNVSWIGKNTIKNIIQTVDFPVSIWYNKDCFEEEYEENQDEEKDKQIKINLNVATGSQLEKLAGVWPSTAQNIVDYRQDNNICYLEQLKEISWIWPSTVDNIKDQWYYYINPDVSCFLCEKDTKDRIDKNCPHYLEIKSDKIFTWSLSYQIDTNADDFQIKYWITDFFGNEMVSQNKTDNTNQRSFTPSKDHSEIFTINAKLITDKCEKNEVLNVWFAHTNKLKERFDKLYSTVRDVWYIIEDNFDIRAPRTDKTYKQLYEEEKEESKNCSSWSSVGYDQSVWISLIEINTAKEEELTQIDWIWPSYAQNIIDNRPFCQFQDLLEVSGIWPSRLQNIQKSNNVSLQSPEDCFEDDKEEDKDFSQKETLIIEINSATKEKLTKIDGIWKSYAENIIQKRPFCQFEDMLWVSWIWQSRLETIKGMENVFLQSSEDCFTETKKDKKETQKTGKSTVIEINTADKERLAKIDGIWKSYAENIIDNRPICSKQDLLDISWIWEVIVDNIVSDPDIVVDTISYCQDKSKVVKDKIDWDLQKISWGWQIQIVEINPLDDVLPEYITIKSIGGDYRWNLQIHWLGRWSSTREVSVDVMSWEKLVISDSYFGFSEDIDLKLIESVYLTNSGQELKIIGQNWQVMDKVVYNQSNSAQSLYFQWNYEWDYRQFDKFDDFYFGKDYFPDFINNSIEKIQNFDNKLLSVEEKYQRARKYRSNCVKDRDNYLNELRLYRNYSDIVNRKLKSDWYVVFQESWIKDYYDIHQKQQENIDKWKELVNISWINVRPYNLSYISDIKDWKIENLPSRFDWQIWNYWKNKYIKTMLPVAKQVLTVQKDNFTNLMNMDVLNFEGLLWPQKSVRWNIVDRSY